MKQQTAPIGKGRKAAGTLLSTLRSTLLFFFSIFTVQFIFLILHEGGHAVADMVLGYRITLFYVHPFMLSGYVRSLSGPSLNIWQHISGPAMGILVSLILFIVLWKRRSPAILPLIFVFPWAALMNFSDALNLARQTGDYFNLTHLTGWPTWPFFVWCAILITAGIFFFVSLFPLLGLGTKDKKTLFVIPAGLLLWCLASVLVGHVFVPGSTAEVKFHLEIARSADQAPIIMTILGLLLAGVYLTLYRLVEPKLPAGLRTSKVELKWKDLLVPGILCAVSIAVGLAIVSA